MNTLIAKSNRSILNQKPVVVFPVAVWDKMREKIDEMQEDLEMYTSVNYKKSIAQARKSKKLYSSSEARKILGL
ncbi:MAG: hypothetical protein M3Q34_00410 [bacterium]|nr:hypothetical protein [bacterium]